MDLGPIKNQSDEIGSYKLKCEFTVEFPKSIPEGDAKEWIEYCTGHRGGISIHNALSDYELTSDAVDVHDVKVRKFQTKWNGSSKYGEDDNFDDVIIYCVFMFAGFVIAMLVVAQLGDN